MRRTTLAAACLALAVALAGCDQDRTPISPDAAAFGKSPATSTKRPYTLYFSGDVTSAPIPNVMLDPNQLLKSVAQAEVHLTLSPSPDLVGCGVGGGSWAQYGGQTWPGTLLVSTSSGLVTLSLKSRWVNDSSSWLTVQDYATQTVSGGIATLSFSDARSAFNVFGKQTVYPCSSLTVTAVPQ